MKHNEELIELLNDLLCFNNDRILGYQKAIDETNPESLDMLSLYERMLEESERHKLELKDAILMEGGKVDDDGTTNTGKLYRAWMEIKSVFNRNSDRSTLESCEFGEDNIQKAYKKALDSGTIQNSDTRQLIIEQQRSLKESHDEIKRYRDISRVKDIE